VFETHRPQATDAKRRGGPRGKNCARWMERAIRRRPSARRGQRPPLGGETTVARRTLCDRAARAPRASDGPGECCVRRKEGPSVAPLGRPEGGRLWPAPVLSSVSYQPGDAPCWEASARRPDSASALRVCCGTHRAGMVLTTRSYLRVGSYTRRWTAITARGVAATASRAGWRARVRRVGRESGKRTRRRCNRTTERVRGPPRPALPTGNAPRHGACPNLGRRVALNEAG